MSQSADEFPIESMPPLRYKKDHELKDLGFSDWMEVAKYESDPLNKIEYLDKVDDKKHKAKEYLLYGLYAEAFKTDPHNGHVYLGNLDFTEARKCFKRNNK